MGCFKRAPTRCPLRHVGGSDSSKEPHYIQFQGISFNMSFLLWLKGNQRLHTCPNQTPTILLCNIYTHPSKWVKCWYAYTYLYTYHSLHGLSGRVHQYQYTSAEMCCLPLRDRVKKPTETSPILNSWDVTASFGKQMGQTSS